MLVEKFLDYCVMNYLEWLLRIVVAMICGFLIGLERSKRLKEAGVRTHAVVSLSAAVFMIISKYAFIDLGINVFGIDGADPSRIASQVVAGIGFIGAGAIFKNGNLIKGLTTAAGIWATSAIGMAIGSGMYVIGIFATICILFMQFIMHKIKIGSDSLGNFLISFTLKEDENVRTKVNEFFNSKKAIIEESEIEKNDGRIKFSYLVKISDNGSLVKDIEDCFKDNDLTTCKVKKL